MSQPIEKGNTARQIRLLGAYGFFTYPFVCVPFLFFFFQENGLSIGQYLWMIALYYWSMVLTEVPTGMIADRWGRKNAMVAGSLTLSAGFLVICLGSTIQVYFAGHAILGLGHSLLSGAPTALVYDTLKQNGEQGRFLSIESRIHAFRLFGTGASFLVGGVMAWAWGIVPTIAATVVLCLVGAGIAMGVREEKPSRHGRNALLPAALRELRNKTMLWILVYFILLFGLLRFAFHTYQPYFDETVYDDLTPRIAWLFLGALFAALNLVAGSCSRLVPRLTRRLRYRVIFPFLPATLCVSFVLMAGLPNWAGVLLFFAHQVPFGLHWALVQSFVNDRVTTTARATALSILSFLGRVSFALWIPLVGFYEETHGTPQTYLLIGIVGIVLTALWCMPHLGTRLMARDPLAPVVPHEHNH